MDNIISFDNFLKGKNAQSSTSEENPMYEVYEQVDIFKQALSFQSQQMDTLLEYAVDGLKDAGFDVSNFELNIKSADQFLHTSVFDREEDGLLHLSLVFEAHVQEAFYRICSELTSDGETSVNYSTDIYKLENDEWLWRNRAGSWEQGPGKEFFVDID